MAPAPYAAAPGPLGPPAVSGAGAPCGRGRPRGGGPPAPKGGGLGQLRYAAGRVQAGPVLARPGRPRPNRSGPALSGPGPWALAAVGVGWWLAAGPPARGRPASGLVAGRLGAGGRSPPAGALCRGAVARPLAAAAWAWGWRPGLRPCPACALPDLPRRGPPPRPGGGVGAAPCLGPARGSLWAGPGRRSGGQRPPGPAPFPTPGLSGTMPPGRRGVWCPPCGLRPAAPPMRGGWGLDSAACGRRGTKGGGNRRPKIIFPTNAAPRRHRDIGNSCASYS